MARKTPKKSTRKTPAKTARRPQKTRSGPAQRKREKNRVAQRTTKDYTVGYGKPPVEHRFQPGQSGNPAGPPKARTNLWPTLCRMMAMNEKELAALAKDRKKLSLVQLTALKLVSQIQAGVPRDAVGRLLIHMIERDEGKPVQSLHLDTSEDLLSPEECEEIRQAMRGDRQPPQNTP